MLVASSTTNATISLAEAQTVCAEPVMPMPVNGAAATADQMRAAMADARNFIAQSGVYQDCLSREVDAAKDQAVASGQALDPVVESNAKTRLEASRKAQERVDIEASNAMAAYKNAHSH